MSAKAVFEGLVFDEAGRPLGVTTVGDQAQYVIDDDGFLRHIDAEFIDRQIVDVIREQINANKQMVEEGLMQMIGSDDLFTKAAIDVSIKNMDEVLQRGIPEDARMWLGMMGFRVIVNLHGEIVRIDSPQAPADEGE